VDQGVIETLQKEYHCTLLQSLIEVAGEGGEIENFEGNKRKRCLLYSPCLGGNLEGNKWCDHGERYFERHKNKCKINQQRKQWKKIVKLLFLY
jgi:hypothetical protein